MDQTTSAEDTITLTQPSGTSVAGSLFLFFVILVACISIFSFAYFYTFVSFSTKGAAISFGIFLFFAWILINVLRNLLAYRTITFQDGAIKIKPLFGKPSVTSLNDCTSYLHYLNPRKLFTPTAPLGIGRIYDLYDHGIILAFKNVKAMKISFLGPNPDVTTSLSKSNSTYKINDIVKLLKQHNVKDQNDGRLDIKDATDKLKMNNF